MLWSWGQGLTKYFKQKYKCQSMTYLGKDSWDDGGKIILPASALNIIAQLNVNYPLMFSVSNSKNSSVKTHCGVIEFTAPEGTAGLPYWVMAQLQVDEGNLVDIEYVSLKPGKYFKIKPHTSGFLESANPKAILETKLRNYSALTLHDLIQIEHNKKKYSLEVTAVDPNDQTQAISIVETDVRFEFEEEKSSIPTTTTTTTTTPTPKNSMESGATAPISIGKTEEKTNVATSPNSPIPPTFQAFQGTGYSLKKGNLTQGTTPVTTKKQVVEKDDSSSEDDEENSKKKKFSAFAGTGYSLKK